MTVCAIIPTYENPQTLREIVTRVRAHIADVLVVDDGSSEEAKTLAESLEMEGLCTLIRHEQNRGKGSAVKSGFIWASEHGFVHALQIDADLQHDTNDIPAMLAAIRGPRSLVLAQPIFDETAPRSRLFARKISIFWASIETMSSQVGDPLCGFRVYPVALAVNIHVHGDAMDFDPEMAVRLIWAGAEVAHVPTRVRYLSRDEGGVSHFRNLEDTVLISIAHSRLCLEAIWAGARGLFRARP